MRHITIINELVLIIHRLLCAVSRSDPRDPLIADTVRFLVKNELVNHSALDPQIRHRTTE